MKKIALLMAVVILTLLISCGDNDSTNPTKTQNVEMTISGDQNLVFKSNDVNIVLPPANPDYLVSAFMSESGKTHTFSMTIDSDWVSEKTIDLTRDENKATFAYDAGKDGNTYRVISGSFQVEEISATKIRGTINFTAGKIGDISKTITVTNGNISVSK